MNYDEKPIGQHKEIPSLTEYATNEEEHSTNSLKEGSSAVTLAERLASKNWKTRLDAFTELAKQFSPGSTSPEVFSQHINLFARYLADSHPGAQEKAMDAFSALINCGIAIPQSNLNDLIVALVEKCLSGKITIKNKGMEAIIFLLKSYSQQSIIATIIDLITPSKSPKVVLAGLQALSTIAKEYGKDQSIIKDILTAVEKNAASSTNSSVRAASLIIYQEAYVWLKEEIMPFVNNLKHTQQEELKKQFADISQIKPKEDIILPQAEENKEEPMVLEKTAETEPSDVFGETWCNEIIKLKKWSEKKEKLEELIKATALTPLKIKCSSELISTLKILMNDTNIIVVNATLKVIGQLAANLKDGFIIYHKGLIRPLLQRFKDKKSTPETEKCLENMSTTMRFEDMIEDVKEELLDRSTSMRTHICLWLEKSILPNANPNTIKAITNLGLLKSLIKLSDEATVEVRDAALGCIGIIKAIVGDGMQNFVADLNQQKQEKVKMAADLAKSKYGDKWSKAIGNDAIGNKCGKEATKTKNLHRKSVSPPPGRKLTASRQQTTKLPEKSPTILQEIKPLLAKTENEEGIEFMITEEDADKIIQENIPESIFENIKKTEWKDRQKALQNFNEWILNNREKAISIYETIIVWLNYKLKDFKESNQTILKEAFSIISTITTIQPVSKKFASVAIPSLLEKIADAKWVDTCSNIVMVISNSASASFVAMKIVGKVEANSKNLNLVKGGLCMLSRLIEGSKSNTIPLKPIANCGKTFILHPNQAVRACASTLLCTMYEVFGEQLKQLLGDLKESAMKPLELQFAKIQIKSSPETEQKEIIEPKEKLILPQAEEKKDKIENIQQRINISTQITQDLINSLSDAGVKQRQKAKEQIEKILVGAKNKIQATGLGSLMGALKDRMSEPCKSLGKGFIELVGNLFSSMGTGSKQYCKLILQELVSNLADKQGYIRAETLAAMNKCSEAVGAELIINTVGQLIEKESPDLRLELLRWIIKNKDALKNTENLQLISGLTNCLQDKSAEIRKMAEQLVELLLHIVGNQPFTNEIQDYKPTTKAKIEKIIKKYSETNQPMEIEVSIPKEKIEKMEIQQPETTVNKFKESDAISPIQEEISPKETESVSEENKDNSCKSSNSSPTNMANIQIDQVFNTIEGEKEKRVELDKRVKYSIDESKTDLMERIKKQIKRSIHSTFFDLMFSKNGKKQMTAINILTDALNQENEIAGLISVLDLIFKWISAVLSDQSSSSTISKVLTFLKTLFIALISRKYQFLDLEAASILPLLVERIGINNNSIKEDFKELIKSSCALYPPIKVFNFLMRALNSKQYSTRIESLGLLGEMVEIHGLEITTARDIKTLGKLVINQNGQALPAAFKQACLDFLALIYKYKGEAIWSNLGDIPDSIHDLLMTRFIQSDPTKVINETSPKKSAKKANHPSSSPTKNSPSKEENKFSLFASSQNLNYETAIKKEAALQEKHSDDFDDIINMLQSQDLSKKADALAILNEKATAPLTENQEIIIQNISDLLCMFAEILREIFAKENNEIPIRFAKCLLTTLATICGNKALVFNATKCSMITIMEQLLVNLLHEGLEKLGENKEGEIIQKGLNSAMLMLLKNCNPTQAFCGLIELFYKHREEASTNKLSGLIVKCILKLTKVISTLIPILDVGELLVCIHEYLLCEESQNPQSEIGTKIAKTIISELVKVKKESIWDCYNKVGEHQKEDVLIKRWIAIIIKSNNQQQANTSGGVEMQKTQPLRGLIREEMKFRSGFGSNNRQNCSQEPQKFEFASSPSYQISNTSFGFQDPATGNATQSTRKFGVFNNLKIPERRPLTAREALAQKKKQEEANKPMEILSQKDEAIHLKKANTFIQKTRSPIRAKKPVLRTSPKK